MTIYFIGAKFAFPAIVNRISSWRNLQSNFWFSFLVSGGAEGWGTAKDGPLFQYTDKYNLSMTELTEKKQPQTNWKSWVEKIGKPMEKSTWNRRGPILWDYWHTVLVAASSFESVSLRPKSWWLSFWAHFREKIKRWLNDVAPSQMKNRLEIFISPHDDDHQKLTRNTATINP